MALLNRKKDSAADESADKTADDVGETEEIVVEETDGETKKSNAGAAYFVSPHPDGGWQVKKAGAQRALKRFKTKKEAEEYAKTVAANQGTHVVRQKKDGKIQKKR